MSISEDLSRITLQEQTLLLPRFDAEVAWRIGIRLRELAIARNLGLVIDVRRFGEPLFYAALPGTSPNNAEWARRKGNIVAHFSRSSYGVHLDLLQQKTTLTEKHALAAADYAAAGGSFPICVENAGVIGSVTVSGLPQRADHELVVEILCLETARDYASLKLQPQDW